MNFEMKINIGKIIKNILRGMGSIINIYPNTDYRRNLPQRTDSEALRQDWINVGRDLRKAMKKIVGAIS